MNKKLSILFNELTTSIHLYTLTVVEALLFIFSHYLPDLQKAISVIISFLLNTWIILLGTIGTLLIGCLLWKYKQWSEEKSLSLFILFLNIYTSIIPYTVINVDEWTLLSNDKKIAFIIIVVIMIMIEVFDYFDKKTY